MRRSVSTQLKVAAIVAICLLGCAISRPQQASSQAIARAKNAVVIVTTYDARGKARAQGSGFFIDRHTIVTNAHVIREAASIRIKTFDGSVLPIQQVIATDSASDLALLRSEATSGKSASLEVDYGGAAEGEPITVISNPKGSTWKITDGVAGAIWDFSDSGPRIAITASILPGSSGGPVLNQQGRVIGIVVAHTASADDLNFAIPAAALKNLQASAKLAMLTSN